jgi:iron complex transport system substrate-binding protein
VLLLVAGLLISGCNKAQMDSALAPVVQVPATGFPVTVTDDSGRRVTLSTPPRRIVSLSPAHTETLYAIGVGNRVVAADTYSDYPPNARKKAQLKCWPKPPLEEIVALKPDLVVVLTEGDEFLRQMEAVRTPVLKLFPRTYEKALEGMIVLGRVTGTEASARKRVASMRERTRKVQERVQGARPRRVLYEVDGTDPARPWVAGPEGFYGAVLALAGGKNVFDDLKGSALQVSTEQIVARDPEVIFFGDPKALMATRKVKHVRDRTGWAAITAVRQGDVFGFNSDRITRPGPRLIDALEEVARVLHPDRF